MMVLSNQVEGEDLFDNAVLSKVSFEEMLDGVSTVFAKKKLWKKVQELKGSNFTNSPTVSSKKTPSTKFPAYFSI